MSATAFEPKIQSHANPLRNLIYRDAKSLLTPVSRCEWGWERERTAWRAKRQLWLEPELGLQWVSAEKPRAEGVVWDRLRGTSKRRKAKPPRTIWSHLILLCSWHELLILSCKQNYMYHTWLMWFSFFLTDMICKMSNSWIVSWIKYGNTFYKYSWVTRLFHNYFKSAHFYSADESRVD